MKRNEVIDLLTDLLSRSSNAEEIIEEIEARGFAIYAKRRPPKERRPNSSAPMTDRIKQMIIRDYQSDHTITQSKLAARYNVNSGRVAEALAGVIRG